jgi:phosphotransferase system, enzyme I, PtsP
VVAAKAASVPVSLCGEAGSRPLEALVLAALGITTLSMPASGILPIKAMLSQVDLGMFRSVLATVRRGSGSGLRESVATWAREHGIQA